MSNDIESPKTVRQCLLRCRTRISGVKQVFAVMAAGLVLAALPMQAANILTNPGFEADGNHGSGVAITGWTGAPSGPWYINTDQYAHSGNNYYKVWGAFNGGANYQAVYQDNDSLPTSTYQADGWQFTLSSDLMWSGDDLDYSWLEVSFRDANNNILALYRSDQFSDTLSTSGFSYQPNTWYDFPVTNICETNAPYAIIGSTNVLEAPPGTVKVRFQHTLYQAVYGGGSVYFDDATLNQTGGPVPPQITQVYPGNLLFASNHISFHVTSASSSPIAYTNIHVVVNGADVSSSCSYSGATPDISVSYAGLNTNVWAYTASITVTDAYGFTASSTMNFDTITPTYVWEAEDYDFTNGMFYQNPVLSSTPQPDSYFGVTGTEGVDYFRAAASGQNATYRTNDWPGIGPAAETPRQKFLTAQLTDSAVKDWTVGYIAIGDWFNYTRDYPAGTYNIYARLAGGSGATTVALSNVISGTLLGNFQFTGTDWGAYHYVPLQDANGNLLPFTFDGSQQTLSVTLLSGGENMNFFMLVPAQVGLPTLSDISPTNNSVMATNKSFSFTVTAPSGSTINNSGIHLSLNGADVSSSLSFSGSGLINVSCPLLQSNQPSYTAVIAVTNTSGAGITRTVQFDTMSSANFYVKMEDFDFSGGQYDTAGNGLVPNAYIGDGLPNDTGAILGVDYNHGTDGTFLYRGPNALATEITSDVPLPGYNAGSDYDIGNFDSGDWANYTRNYPAGKYWVYGRLAGYGMNTTLSQVTSGLGTSTQTLSTLGTWIANPGGWQTWAWVLLQKDGVPVVVNLNGVSTLRVTSAGNCNANYFMLVPVKNINISATQAGGNVQISFPTTAGSSYRVFYTTSLTSGNWTLLSTVPGDGTVKSTTDSAAGGSLRFYKVTSP